jgi:hypothetical protein
VEPLTSFAARPHQESGRRALRLALFVAAALLRPLAVAAQENSDCLTCHDEKDRARTFAASVHKELPCVGCHTALAGRELPHDTPLAPPECGGCHADEKAQHDRSLHGRAVARRDPLAPRCKDCHGSHDIRAIKDPLSAVTPLRIPFVCGRCHSEGTPVQRQRHIPQDHILENYSESIHGQGLLRKGLIVAPHCASCHTAHSILPHTDPSSSIARRNIAKTCARCHAQIEQVHRKIIRGELWEKQANVLPACVDCHQPHKIRRVLYDQGAADSDCLRCHAERALKGRDGRSLFVDDDEVRRSRHQRVACSQCHSEVSPAHARPCDTITHKVTCASCHAEVGTLQAKSVHGRLEGRGDAQAPTCKLCHGTHGVLGRLDPRSPTFPRNIPDLCARCHREGGKATLRYGGAQHQIVERFTESIHGKGLLQSGLTVTATCTSCHTAHGILPRSDPESSVNPQHLPATCGRCHHGIEEQFVKSIHAQPSDKPQPACSDCHTAHAITRADSEGFRMGVMNTCGRCHAEVARSYFDTYHGKVSQLGFAKTAKCHDCHGAHDILPVNDPASHLSRTNVVATCRKCHPGASRRFAGYLTHATHHDPRKYPLLYWTFWGMTSLLIVTFVGGGLHTLLWLPRAIEMRREIRRQEAAAAAASPGAGLRPSDPKREDESPPSEPPTGTPGGPKE